MVNRSILDVLPLDIMELVVREGESYERKDFCALRLVCKALNELVEPEVFSTVSIRFTHDDSEKWRGIPEFLSSLASGRSPYVRWAKELRVDALIPIQFANVQWSRYDPWQGEEREMMLACQKEWLTPAIESLVQVERVQFVANSREPYHDTLCALSKLPRLRDISIFFHPYTNPAFEDAPFASFSNLNSIRLNGLTMTQHIFDNVKVLLARSPSITELALNVTHQPDAPEVKRLELHSLVEDATQPNFSPTLKKLTISATQLNLSPSCAPFLRSLASLVILNGTARVQPSFWKSLTDSGIHLQELRVAPLSQPIIDYLLSYSGLRDFTLGWSEDTEDVEKIVPQFFHAVLPRHRDVIQSISSGHNKLGPWTITQSYLDEGVYLCKGLKYLTLIYYFPSPNEKCTHAVIPLSNLFSEISDNLPQLQTLRLELTRKFQRSFGCGFACGEYFRTVGTAFASHIISSKSRFSAKRQPQFFLEAAETAFISKPVSAASSGSESDSGSGSGKYYRFDLLHPSEDLELQPDGVAQDCDAYSDDEGFY